MKGTLSFHPIDMAFFDDIVAPLLGAVRGGKLDTGPVVTAATRVRLVAWRSRRLPLAMQTIMATAGPAKPDPNDTLLRKLRVKLEAFDYRPDEATKRLFPKVDPELHLTGRPFFITDAAPMRVAEAIDQYLLAATDAAIDEIARAQLALLDPALVALVTPVDPPALSSDYTFRSDLVSEMKRLNQAAVAARRGGAAETAATGSAPGASRVASAPTKRWHGGLIATLPAKVATDQREGLPAPHKGHPAGTGRPASTPRELEKGVTELPWNALRLHARVVPYWTAQNVDGLETVCRSAGIPGPDCLVPPRRLFAEALEAIPVLADALHLELVSDRSLGAFVPPAEVPELLEFLKTQGARIISAATRSGEGPAVTRLLQKIRECATFAERHGFGYLEASGLHGLGLPDEVSEPASS